MAYDINYWAQWCAFAVQRASTTQHNDALALKAGPEFVQQPGFADARLPRDVDGAHRVKAPKVRHQYIEFAVTAYKFREALAPRRSKTRRIFAQAQ